MLGAVGINLILFPLILRSKPKLGDIFHLPTKKDIDLKLLLGSTCFGIGWGIAGICPGPGLVNLSRGDAKSLIFVTMMIVGMLSFALYNRWCKNQ